MSSENGFRIIALPTGKRSSEDILQQILEATTDGGGGGGHAPWAYAAEFPIPGLKMGSLDQLVSLNEEFGRLDGTVAGLVEKVVDTMKNVQEESSEASGGSSRDHAQAELVKIASHALVVNGSDEEVLYADYLMNWQWNRRKYRSEKSLRELYDQFGKELHQLDNLMKNKINQYQQAKTSLTNFERKKSGNYTTRDLTDLVSKDHFVLDSEYLETVLVVVPRQMEKQWQSTYERLSPMVVPRSAQKISEEKENSLFAVVIFQRIHDEFVKNARENKFTVREFKWDDSALEKQKEESESAKTIEKELRTDLLRLARTTFGDAFGLYVHVKAIRTFTEAILRFGLPPDFASIIIRTPVPPRSNSSLKQMARALPGVTGTNKKNGYQPPDVSTPQSLASFAPMISSSKSGQRLTKTLQTLFGDLQDSYNAGNTNEVTKSEYASLLGPSDGELSSWVDFSIADPLARVAKR